MIVSRAVHLDYCKRNALKRCEVGEYTEAVKWLVEDMDLHNETRAHPARLTAIPLLVGGALATREQVLAFIESIH